MKKITFLILLIFICAKSLFASSYLFFKRFQVEDGLSHNTVWCGLQDSYGFLWFGTSDGLNCYDGRTNKIYRNVLNDKFSLENNFVQTLFEENQRNIWVGTNWGIYIYDRNTNHFTHFNKRTNYGVLISSEVRKIIRTHNGLIWIATLGQGLFIYNPKTNILIQNSLQTSFVWDICESNTHNVYISSLQDGLFCFNENGIIKKLPSAFTKIYNNTGRHKVNCIANIGGSIWMGTDDKRLYKWDEHEKMLSSYDASPVSMGVIRCMLDYSKEELLLGTENGAYLFNYKTGNFSRADDPSLRTGALSDLSINNMLKDAEGGIWVLTNLGGINYASKQTKHFESYYSADSSKEDSGIVVGPFCEDQSGNIWIGTRDGLYLLNAKTHQLAKHPISSLAHGKCDIRTLFLDANQLWIGTYGDGVKVYNINTGAVKEYHYSRDVLNTICSNDVLSIYKTHSGNIYIGTSWGLCQYNPKEDNFSVVIAIGTMISVIDITEDHQGNLWVATSNSGVFRYQPKSGNWKHFEHKRKDSRTITDNYVITMFEDSKGTMWFGTNGGGLCSFNSSKEVFTDFDPDNAILPSKVIYSIEEDKKGNFWISSNMGLIKINPYKKEFLRRFTTGDGLQGNQFNAHSSLKTARGKFYFGGVNGFNAFTPEALMDNKYIPPVYITDIQLTYTNDEHLVKKILDLKQPLYASQEITLPYEYNSFVISFAALSYEDPGKNRYSYILKGVDKEWVTNSKINSASYTNLSPGKYEFIVRGSNNDNKWNTKGTTITIIITPPWWRTSWAYTAYILLFLGIAYYMALKWDEYVKTRYRRRMEEFRISKEKEIYESKIGFFINLVHEIRTPLSLICIPLEKLMKDNEDKEMKYLSIINKNVNYLLNITTQLLDFQKMESGKLQLNLQSTNISELIENVYEQFIGPAELKGITIILTHTDEAVYAKIDPDKVRKVLVNLFGNAIKYAKSNIEIVLKYSDKDFEISVNDDGIGIPNEEKEKVFEAFYQIQNREKAVPGTGIGLAFSKSLAEAHKGELRIEDSSFGGSSFILRLPIKDVVTNKKSKPEIKDTAIITTDEEKDVTVHPNNGKLTVLLVEDNIDLLNLTKEALSPTFRILKAANGVEALEILSNESVDVIVSDIMMPEMDGLELTTKIKTTIDYSHIPVILLTAKTTLESKVEGLECGADAYIDKPFSVRQLQMQIENLIKLRQSFHKMMIDLFGTQTEEVTTEYALSQKDREFIARIQEVITEQMADENFYIDSLAEVMHMSRSNFYRKIKALSGMSPNDYLKTIRLNRAAELIKSGERISEVAERVGFTSSSYFAKCFKTQFGVLPRDYKG